MRRVFVVALVAFGVVRCSEAPLGTPPEETLLPGVIVSEALPPARMQAMASAGSTALVAYVSLPPGTLPDVVMVRIRNLTTAGTSTSPVPVLEGGFDPVAVLASAGDRLELQLTDRLGSVTEEHAMVPVKRLPVVVRTSPARGRTDVALSVRPVVVFSEPIDPVTLTVGMRLVTGGTLVNGRVELVEPWIAQFIPESPLEPGTGYQLELTREVRGVDGLGLEAPVTADFTTDTSAPPPPGVPLRQMRIAFTSTRDGTERVYLANADGSGLVRLTSGSGPAWSWDDDRIAFHRETLDGPVIGVINVDGSGERVLGRGMWPSWSPDGRISFVSDGGISVMNADGSGVVLLLSHEFAYPGCQPPVSIYAWWGDCVADPSWSPDGRRIAFYAGDAGYGLAEVYTMNADGSAPRRLVSPGETTGWNGVLPAWSPDGARVAFEWGGPLSHISSLPREGTGTLTTHATGYAPAWSPDGHWLAYRGTGAYEQRIVGTNIVTGEFHGLLIPEAEGPADPSYWDTQVDWSHTIRGETPPVRVVP